MRKKGTPIKNTFWELIAKHKEDYDIRVSASSSKRSAKRITILVSNAFLSCIGEVNATDYLFHWIQCLEAELYRACKERNLECDPLELEAMERNYFCRKTRKKVFATAFDNHKINTTIIGETPKAKLFAEIITDYLALEEVQDATELSRNNQRKRFTRTFEYKEERPLSFKKKGAALCGVVKNSEGVPG